VNLRSIARWTGCMLVVLVFSGVVGSALGGTTPPTTTNHVPEASTLVLMAMGGAGVAWQYFRARVRK
jgi:hypothetical protein